MEGQQTKKPEWVPDGECEGFACKVMEGVAGGHDGIAAYHANAATSDQVQDTCKTYKRPQLSAEEYAQGVLASDRALLGRAITLVESNAERHIAKAQKVLHLLLPYTGRSIRIGITGVPGVGKSTFIEAFGCYLIEQGHKVAVLAVDPSSSISGGSILGDKTRMERLSREENCFIRPSPTGTTLGGVARKTRETMLVCEAAGFDVVLIETVGVGQSETTVRSMADFFLLLMLAGAGDELQGIKKGIMELADALVINKADGKNKMFAETARNEYERAMHYLQPSTEGWVSHAFTCSAMTGDGIAHIWRVIEKYCEITAENGAFARHRQEQNIEWVHDMVDDHLRSLFGRHEGVRQILHNIEQQVGEGLMPAVAAVQHLIRVFEGRDQPDN